MNDPAGQQFHCPVFTFQRGTLKGAAGRLHGIGQQLKQSPEVYFRQYTSITTSCSAQVNGSAPPKYLT